MRRPGPPSLRSRAGFTLLELLVVIIVLGILVTIVIPRFADTREKSYDAAALADLRNAMSAQEAYYADHQAYATDVGGGGLELASSNAVTVSIASAGAEGYVMTAKHASSSNTYCIDSTSGEIVIGATC